jgi:hypothetical protein
MPLLIHRSSNVNLTNKNKVNTPDMTTKRIAIIQSCYIPWKGFFDLVSRCDEYVIFDSAQYVKRHWHNRNKLMTAKGTEWITIPVISKSRFEQPLDEVEISEPWAERHWKSIELSYKKAPFFASEAEWIRTCYEAADKLRRLTDVNRLFFEAVMSKLNIKTRLVPDRQYALAGQKSERLLNICRSASATHYLSGPSARAYLDETIFEEAGIKVEWMAYGPYPTYPQLYGPFEHAVSILDAIFNLGVEARTALQPLPSGTSL